MRNSPRFAPERIETPLPATNSMKLDKSTPHNKKKSDLEIKEFIDSREVLTKYELSMFIFGVKDCNNLDDKKVLEFWHYTLETKNWKTLKDYQKSKIHIGRPPLALTKLYELLKTDKRLAGYGKRKLAKYVNDMYGFKVSPSTTQKFLQQIRGKNA
jgi:hypothetical protein